MRFICSLCRFETQRFSTYLRHYGHHPKRAIHCNIDGCLHLQHSRRGYVRHIKSAHKEFYVEHCTSRRNFGNRNIEIVDTDNEENSSDEEEALGQNIVDRNDEPHDEFDANDDVSNFLLGLREGHKVTSQSCTYVADRVGEILKTYREQVSASVYQILQRAGANVEELSNAGLSDAFDESQYEKAFEHMSTKKNFEKYVANQSHYIPPEEYVFERNNGGKEETMQYVSILKTLTALLQDDDIFAEVYNGHSSAEDGVLKDFCDGSLFKENTLFSQNDMSLQIQLYYDEFCVGNPLGNKTKKMKFGAFYYLLGNISPCFRSKLHVIQLCTLCLSSHIKQCT